MKEFDWIGDWLLSWFFRQSFL